MSLIENFLFIGLPYVALIVFMVGTIYRYRATKFTYSSLSSQFLENRKLFWGIMPFHWGLLLLFLGHLIAFLFPSSVLAFNRQPVRLLILEATAFACGLLVLYGLVMLFLRRNTNSRLKPVTSRMDVVIEVLLMAQVVLGLLVALNVRWGSSWFAAVLTPYLQSIFVLQPDISAVSALPWLIKLHIVGAYLIVLFIPFSRLVHLLVVPIHYLWRPYQRVIWNWPRRAVRDPREKWTFTQPHNN
jgi:nitrate reductase gamma subunit